MLKSMTYDQGREMHRHIILTERTGMKMYLVLSGVAYRALQLGPVSKVAPSCLAASHG